MVVRSHQVASEGCKVMHSGRLLTVFSARNYHGDSNDGALLLMVPNSSDGTLRVSIKRLIRQEEY